MPKFDVVHETLGEEPVPTDMRKLADQIIQREPLPQPGPGYGFRLPAISLADENWDDVEGDGGVKGFSYTFRGGQELVVIKAPRQRDINKPVGWIANNLDRKMGDNVANTMVYLIQATVPDMAEKLQGKPNSAWARALVAASGQRFRGRLDWAVKCNPKNDIYKVTEDESGNVVEAGVVKGKKGCGRSYATRIFKKRDGSKSILFPRYEEDVLDDAGEVVAHAGDWVERFDCLCGARLGAFAEIREILPFGSASEGAPAQEAKPEGNGEVQEEATPTPAPPAPAPASAKAVQPPQAPAAPAAPRPARRR